VNGAEHVGVLRVEPGRGAVDVLSGLLGQVVAELRGEKNMRWGDPKLSFARPIRWLVALLGETVVPVAVSGLDSGRRTRLHRTAEPSSVDVPSADGYLDFLARNGIAVDAAVRRERIVASASELAAGVGGSVDSEAEAALLAEVTNLVEEPTPILGSFDPSYLELPAEVLTTVMRKHQRYLPVRDVDNRLLPHFVAVANGSVDVGVVRAGNEAVLRARYEDAAFFWRADLHTPPERMKDGLAKLTFAEGLGSMADRAERIAALAEVLAERVELSPAERAALGRAGELAKFDLASQMVIELSSLAGVMAREYARRAGEDEAVAAALFEMELPRQSGDALPAGAPGALLSLADRFDLLVGLFGVGASPTGSSDPFGLRRAALGLVSVLRAFPALRSISVSLGLRAAVDRLAKQDVEVPAAAVEQVAEFVLRRYEQ
jgi:glycyl-tRNA synthetase